MQTRSMLQVWRGVVAVVALTATAMALYTHFFEARSRQEEARAAALRLEDALVESRSRLKSEILAELRADLAAGRSAAEPAEGPVPDAVLRRPGRDEDASGALRQTLDPTGLGPPLTLGRLAERVESLATQLDESDRTLRRDLESFRIATQRELDASSTARSLELVALIALVLHLLTPWRIAG
jgi:hypothetical protein